MKGRETETERRGGGGENGDQPVSAGKIGQSLSLK